MECLKLQKRSLALTYYKIKDHFNFHFTKGGKSELIKFITQCAEIKCYLNKYSEISYYENIDGRVDKIC